MDETVIRHRLASFYSQPPSQYLEHSCLLYLTLAIGCNAEARSITQAQVDLGNIERKTADDYFKLGLDTLQRLENPENPELWTVQAWALMAVYSISTSKWGAAYTQIGESLFCTVNIINC